MSVLPNRQSIEDDARRALAAVVEKIRAEGVRLQKAIDLISSESIQTQTSPPTEDSCSPGVDVDSKSGSWISHHSDDMEISMSSNAVTADAYRLCEPEAVRAACTVCTAIGALADCNALVAHYESELQAASVGSRSELLSPAQDPNLAALSSESSGGIGTTLTFASAEAGVMSARCRGIVAEIEVALMFRKHCGNFDGWRHGLVSKWDWRVGRCSMNGHSGLPMEAVVAAGPGGGPTRQEIDIVWFPPVVDVAGKSMQRGAAASLDAAPPIFCEVKEGQFLTAYIVDIDGVRSLDERFESLLVQLKRYKQAAQYWYDDQQLRAYIAASAKAVTHIVEAGVAATESSRISTSAFSASTSPVMPPPDDKDITLPGFGTVTQTPCPKSYCAVHHKRCATTEKTCGCCYFRRRLDTTRRLAECGAMGDFVLGSTKSSQGATLYRPVVAVALLGGYSEEVRAALYERGVLCFSDGDDFASNIVPRLRDWHSAATNSNVQTESAAVVPNEVADAGPGSISSATFTVQSPWMPRELRTDIVNLDQTGLCLFVSDMFQPSCGSTGGVDTSNLAVGQSVAQALISSSANSNQPRCKGPRSSSKASALGKGFMVKTAINWYDSSIMGPRVDLTSVDEVRRVCSWFRSCLLLCEVDKSDARSNDRQHFSDPPDNLPPDPGKQALRGRTMVVFEDAAAKFEVYLASMGSEAEKRRWQKLAKRCSFSDLLRIQDSRILQSEVAADAPSQLSFPTNIFVVTDLPADPGDATKLSAALWSRNRSPEINAQIFKKYEDGGLISFLDFGFAARLVNCSSQNWAMAHMGAMLVPDINLAHTYMPSVRGEVWHTVKLECERCGCTGQYKSTAGGRKVGVEPGAAFSKSRVRIAMAAAYHVPKIAGEAHSNEHSKGALGSTSAVVRLPGSSRHRFRYSPQEMANGLKDLKDPQVVTDSHSICKECHRKQQRDASERARETRVHTKWFFLAKRLKKRATLSRGIFEFWKAHHTRDRLAVARAVLSGKSRAQFDGSEVLHPPSHMTDVAALTLHGFRYSSHARANLTAAKRALRQKIDSALPDGLGGTLGDNLDSAEELLRFGVAPLDLFGVALMLIMPALDAHNDKDSFGAKSMPPQSAAKPQQRRPFRTWHCRRAWVGDRSALNAVDAHNFRKWMVFAERCKLRIQAMQHQFQEIVVSTGTGTPAGRDGTNDSQVSQGVVKAISEVAKPNVKMFTDPLDCYTYDERIQRCTRLRKREDVITSSEIVSVVGQSNLFAADPDAAW